MGAKRECGGGVGEVVRHGAGTGRAGRQQGDSAVGGEPRTGGARAVRNARSLAWLEHRENSTTKT